jgi:anaphase-promoting complex subunit 1
VSSLLARADLSASQTASFADAGQGLGLNGSHIDGRRVTSHGSQRGRMSSGHGRASLAIANTLDSLLEAPTSQPADSLLDELRVDGDFEGTGFQHLGLDGQDLASLSREISFTKIHSVPMDNTNVRYSLSSKPAKLQSKVFILVGPTSVIDEQGRIGVLIGVQDGIDRRLQLLNLHVSFEMPATSGNSNVGLMKASVTFGQLRRAQSVVDSCKIVHGPTSMILILSEDKNGQRELSLQAPWTALMTVTLPPLKTGVASILSSDEPLAVSTPRKGASHNRQPSTVDIVGTLLVGTNHATDGGIVDLKCRDGSAHRISIQLRAREPLVQRIIDVCQSVLPPSSGDRILAGWWHAMRWLSNEVEEQEEERFASLEWSALVVTLFTIFLGVGKTATSLPDNTAPRALGDFDAMMAFEAANSSICALWMMRKPWQWILDNPPKDSPQSTPVETSLETFLTRHIRFAKAFMASSAGQAAIGSQGYLPTSSSNSNDVRRIALATMMTAMHLLLEELKLDILQSEETSPSLTDLRSLLSQLARWLRWREHGMVYELGMQEDPDARHDMGKRLGDVILPQGVRS